MGWCCNSYRYSQSAAAHGLQTLKLVVLHLVVSLQCTAPHKPSVHSDPEQPEYQTSVCDSLAEIWDYFITYLLYLLFQVISCGSNGLNEGHMVNQTFSCKEKSLLCFGM